MRIHPLNLVTGLVIIAFVFIFSVQVQADSAVPEGNELANMSVTETKEVSTSVAAAAQEQPREDYGMIKVGESLFAAYCTSCHGPSAEGDGSMAESLRVKPTNLTLLARDNGGEFPFERTKKKIDGREPVKGHGSSDMPIWGQVFTKTDESATEEKVRDKVAALTHFIRSLQAN